jgi:hypothetical protein
MLKFDTNKSKFEQLEQTGLKPQSILERYDLQKAIVRSWDLFKNEIGLPAAYLIGQEIKPDETTQNSIDLLAYNPEDSSLIIIELKRDKHKLQLLQAMSYAAMVSKWDTDILISKLQKKYTQDVDELIDLINNNEINSDIKIILIAESFDPEVIITSDWLSSNYSVNITAFAISIYALEGEKFMSLEQRYPLKELSDAYEMRSRQKKQKKVRAQIEWADVIPKLKYPFAKRGIELCQRVKAGEPSRRRFGSIVRNLDGFTWISIAFRTKYVNAYMQGKFDGDKELIQSKFKHPLTINAWRDGYSVIIENENQFDDLVKWLKLEQ